MRHLYGRKPLEFDFALPTPHNRKPRLHRIVVLAVIAAAVITIFITIFSIESLIEEGGRDDG